MNTELIISIIAVVISVFSFITTVITNILGNRREKRQATLEAYNRLQHEVLDVINTYSKEQIQEIAKDPHQNDYKKISALLARCQHFAVGIKQKIYDKKTLKLLGNCYFDKIYDKLLPLIIKKRRLAHNDCLYKELEEVADYVQR